MTHIADPIPHLRFRRMVLAPDGAPAAAGPEARRIRPGEIGAADLGHRHAAGAPSVDPSVRLAPTRRELAAMHRAMHLALHFAGQRLIDPS